MDVSEVAVPHSAKAKKNHPLKPSKMPEMAQRETPQSLLVEMM